MRHSGSVRRSVVVLLFGLACGGAQHPELAPAAAPPTPASPTAAAPPLPSVRDELRVAPEDRTCARDSECTALLTQCSMCEGACTGVRLDRAARYEGALDCTGYRGNTCNYDCRPSFHIEAPRCVDGRCESVRIR